LEKFPFFRKKTAVGAPTNAQTPAAALRLRKKRRRAFPFSTRGRRGRRFGSPVDR
jgi:hypothetical protein